MAGRNVTVRKVSLYDEQDNFVDDTPEARLELAWQITREAWSFTGSPDAERRLQRDVEVLKRRTD